MKPDNKQLQIITNDTVDSLSELDIVTPSIYKSLFSQNAHNLDANIEDEEEITDTLFDKKIQSCVIMQKETSSNANKLSESADKAISAIQSKDESVLAEVLKETQNLRAEIEALKESVYRDELTNAYNRKWMNDTFLTEGTGNLKEAGTLVIIDLNFFKLINDTYGHIVGDKILVFMASKLRASGSEVIRYGGDEFILIFPDDLSEVVVLDKLNKIREKIIAKKLKADKDSFRVSFSIGSYRFKKDTELSQAIADADRNMYSDKVAIKKRITGID